MVDTMKKAGWEEQCHNPSLVQHTGDQSTAHACKPRRVAPSWKGEDWDALEMLK